MDARQGALSDGTSAAKGGPESLVSNLKTRLCSENLRWLPSLRVTSYCPRHSVTATTSWLAGTFLRSRGSPATAPVVARTTSSAPPTHRNHVLLPQGGEVIQRMKVGSMIS